MTENEIAAMHNQPVLVVTHRDVPVSLGRIRVSQPLKGATGPRVEIHFETETMACALGVPLERLQSLRASFDGEQYRHRLPEGDGVWLPPSELGPNPAPPPAPPAVETFPLPPKARLIGPSEEMRKMPKAREGTRR